MSEPTPLSELLSAVVHEQDSARLSIPEDWLQGRAIYGGLSAALCIHAAVAHVEDDLPPLRSVQISFIGPAAPEVVLRPTVVRRGKSTAFVTVDLFGGEQLAVRATLCFGRARDSGIAHNALAMPEVAPPSDCPPFFEQFGEHAPRFTQHFESRFAAGAAPISQACQPEFTAWLRHRDRAPIPGVVALAALADALPPAAMALFSAPAPVSSITWLFDIFDAAPATDDGWWLSRSVCELAGDGYAAQSMTIWAADGSPVIAGRQNVAVFT